ncbi:MAG: molybdopterin-dependent oxidoreductase [Bifidobacteriaceae bacterium]|nr:molybdopterin-dependent oxidoreductase [Bifidobacteriaceae bacterium]
MEVSDLPDPALAAQAFKRAKVIALQVRGDEVADYADVVLPVAPPQEKAGTYINWEGRMRPFPQVLTSTALSDAKVLQRIAQKLGSDASFADLAAAHRALAEPRDNGRETAAVAAPAARPAAPELSEGEALLSTWRQLVDDAAGLAEEPHLAASAPAPRARVSQATALKAGVAAGGSLTVSTGFGSITLPVAVDEDMVDGVVHLPSKSPGSWVLASLGAVGGDVVKLAPADAPAANEEAGK